jgi:RimJ/RimL family protein N-acetyltransferase
VIEDLWPLFGLRLRTPRLELRLPTLEQLAALAELAAAGVHDPAVMPFTVAWTDAPPQERARSTAQYHWRCWGSLTPEHWELPLVTIHGGEVVGTQDLNARNFGTVREVGTGSWLGLRHQGRGIGTEMRAAVLHLIFAGLYADTAVSAAEKGNQASIAISRKLGYADDGLERVMVRDAMWEHRRFRIDRAAWAAHRTVPVQIEGLEPCRELLGAPVTASRGA